MIGYFIERRGDFILDEKAQILFMQTRLIRLASEEWNLPLDKILDVFSKADIFDYIEKGFGIFHCEGDEAVLEDITVFLKRKGMSVNA